MMYEMMEKESNDISNKINNYNLDPIKVNTESIFPYDPYTRSNNVGLFKNSDGDFMDKNSEILNIKKKLSNNPVENIPNMLSYSDLQLNDGFFTTQNTLLDNPPIELKYQTKNRWIKLPQNPQENAIEPFRRLGANTHLSLVDNYKC